MAFGIFSMCLMPFFLSYANQDNIGKKVVIIGASSGIGRAVAKEFAKNYFTIGLVGRRIELLETLQREITTESSIQVIDITKTKDAIKKLHELIDQMGGMDIMIITAGAIAQFDPNQEWPSTKKLIDVDVLGYSAMVFAAIDYFEQQGHGHLVGITSIDALRGVPQAPSYLAVKGYESLLLEGMRNRMVQKGLPIYVTEILPGWVDVEHTTYSEIPGTFWVASAEEVAKQIYDAVMTKQSRAFVPKRWRVFAWFFKFVPDFIFNRLFKN